MAGQQEADVHEEAAPRRVLRALFVSENLGGHRTLHLGLERALRDCRDVEGRFLQVPPPGPLRRLASAPIPGLAALDADLAPLRDQVAVSWQAHRMLDAWTERFDVLHAYTQNAVLLDANRLRRHPSIVSTDATIQQHAAMLPYRRASTGTAHRIRTSRRLEDRVYDAATLIVAQSEWTARSLRDDYGVPDSKLRQVPFGIWLSEPPVRSEPDPPQLTFIGQSMERKGGSRLLDLYRARLGDRCHLNLVTREPVPEQPGVTVLRDLVPGDPRITELLARTAVFVFPSQIDTFGYALLEAMAAGTPVVASRLAAIPEIVEDGVTGILVEPDAGDDELCAAILTMLDDPARRREMGRRAREAVEARFDARATTLQLVKVLHEAVDLY
jgi:glycosyltransferase involved in cell wall biosynthesis